MKKEEIEKFIISEYEMDWNREFNLLKGSIVQIEESSKQFTQIAMRPLLPKEALLEESDWTVVFIDIARTIARSEMSFLVKELLNNEKIKKIPIEKERIKENIFSLLGNNTIILIPMPMISYFLKDLNARYDNTRKCYEFGGIPLLGYSGKISKKHIIVCDKSELKIKYKLRDKKRLWIDINEIIDYPDKVDIYARSIMDVDVINPEYIKILEIKE